MTNSDGPVGPAIAKEQAARIAAGYFTIDEAARDIGEIQGWHVPAVDTLRAQMMDAARAGALVVRHPHTDLPVPLHRRATVRDFYELVTRDDVNVWLVSIGAPFRWVTYEQAAAQPRYIAGSRLWRLPDAIATVAAMPDFGVSADDLKARIQRDAEQGKLTLRDQAHGAEVKSDWGAIVLSWCLYAKDFNAWLQGAGFPEPYRLRDDMAPGAEPRPGARPDTETRQANRLQDYRGAGFVPPRGRGRWQGVGDVAKKLGIARPTLTEDLKKAWAREQERERAGRALRL